MRGKGAICDVNSQSVILQILIQGGALRVLLSCLLSALQLHDALQAPFDGIQSSSRKPVRSATD